MRARLKFAAAVTAGILNSGWAAQSRGAITYTEVAATTIAVPTNPALLYTTAGQPNADTTLTTTPITGEYFSTFSTPTINQNGDTAFSAISNGASGVVSATSATGNTYGLYAQQAGTLVQLAHEGTYAPDRSGNVASPSDSTGSFSTFSPLNILGGIFIGNNDTVTDYERVKANKTSGGSDDSATPTTLSTALAGIISTKSGSLALTYRINDLLSGLNINAIYANGDLNALAVNPSGSIAALMDIGSPSSTYGSIVSDASGSLQFVAQNGAASPIAGANFNGSYGFNNSYVPVINASGQTAFRAGLSNTSTGGTVTSTNYVAIFSQGGGTLHTVYQAYTQTPGTAAGDVCAATAFGNPDINNAGQTTFSSAMVNNSALGAGDLVTATNNSTGVTANNSALFAEYTPGTLSLVARKGNQAYGLAAGTVYNGFSNPVISDSGRIATEVTLANMANTPTLATGTTAAYYEFDPSGAVTLVEQNGTLAPGTSLYFDNLSVNNFAINSLGDMAFESALSSTIGGSTTASGLFAQDPSGTLQLLVETGQSFTIAPGDVSTVSTIGSLSNSGGEDGRLLSWNNNDTVAVDLTFANGQSGIYTIAVSAVPEPTSAALLMASAGLLFRRRRRFAITN